MLTINAWKSLFVLLFIFLLQSIFPLANYSTKNLLSADSDQIIPIPIPIPIPKQKDDHLLKITGTSSARLDTDLIYLTFRIETLNVSLPESYRVNTISSNKVTKVLKANNIPDRNITTKSYNTQEKYRTVRIPSNNTSIRIFDGYQIVNSLEIVLSDVDKLPNLIEELIEAENVLIKKIKFDLSRALKDKVADRLEKEAAQDALKRATVTADTLDLNITDVKYVNVRNINQVKQREYKPMAYAFSRRTARSAPPPTVYSGTSVIESKIMINFIITNDD